MDITELDPEEDCNLRDWPALDLVMSDWERTHSPLAHWHLQLQDGRTDQLYKELLIDDATFRLAKSNISFGLPTSEVPAVCRERYSQDFAKLKVQIAQSSVMQIRKDVRVNFSDQLGTIGTESEYPH